MTMLTIRRALLAMLLALLVPVPSFAQDAATPKPLIVLLETNPRLMAIGSDSPSFALYDDGTAIYLTEAGYKSVKLDAAERAALVEKVNPQLLASLAGEYDIAPGVSDQTTNYLIVYGIEKPRLVSVYGSLKSGTAAGKLPAAIPAAYEALRAFRHPGARDWLPEKIEVMIWPYEYAPDASIAWPTDWPGLQDPATVKWSTDSYSLYLPSADYPAVMAFLKTQKPRGAVKIGGRKWAASVRFPFPRERRWLSRSGPEPD